jgi:hypothetical protein
VEVQKEENNVLDQYEQVRSLSFPALAASLGLDITNYRQRKHGQEFYGPCPIHKPKQNSTSFSYAADGRFNCFSCNAKGRGAIDLTKLVKNLGFKEAVEFLGSIPPPAPKKTNPSPRGISRKLDLSSANTSSTRGSKARAGSP